MKKMNIVRNTITEGTETYRERSRIGSINHRIWSVIAPMLFIVFGLFGVNVEAWGGNVVFNAPASASPTGGGSVSVSPSNQQTVWSAGIPFTSLYYEVEATFTYSASANTTAGYVFKGWSTSSTSNSGDTSSSFSKKYKQKGKAGTVTYNADEYYAIFARLKASSTAEMAFGTKLIGAGWSEGTTKSVTIDYVHAGKITAKITGTNKTEFSLSNSSSSQSTEVVSNNTNSETNSTIKVYFNPSSEGSKSAKLTISSNNDLTSIEINLSGTGQATVNPTFTNTIAASYYVEDGPLNLASLWTSDNENGTITYSKVSFKADVENETGATVPSISNDNKLSLGQAGTLVIQMHQAASTGYYEKTVKDTIRINKRSNTIKIKGVANYSNSIYVDSYDNGLTLTSDNTDYTNCPITNTQTAGKDIATFYQNDKVVYSSYKLGTATWTLSQPENYKYVADSGSITVNVIKQEEATDCYVLTNQSGTEKDWHGNTCHEHTWNDENAAGVVHFEISKDVGIDQGYKVQQKIGNNWVDVTDYKNDHSTSWGNWKTQTLNRAAKGVRFMLKGGSLNYVRNVSVTRATYLEASNVTINETSLHNPIFPMSNEPGVGTLKIDYSLANGGDLKIVNDNPKFTLSDTEISDLDCKTGSATINITYSSDVAGKDTAHVVIYNKVYRKEVVLYGETVKRNQTITWKANFDKMSLYATEDEAATTNVENLTVTYSSDDESIIRVTNEGTRLEAVGEGKTTIHAHTDATAEYNEGHSEKEIDVTPDLVQYIVWNQSLMNMMIGGTKNLNAYATSDIECTTNQNRPITYTSLDPTIASVSGNVLTAHKKGTTTILAYQAGGTDADGHKYVEASYVKTVVVRDPNEPCTADPIFTQGEQQDLFSMELSKPQQNYDIDLTNLDGKPGYLSFACYGENYVVPLIGKKHYSGKLIVAKKIKNNAGNYVWSDVMDLGQPAVDQDNNYSGIAIDTAAIALRIYRPEGGEGHHKIHDAQITLARYMKGTAPAAFQAKVGETQSKTMTLEYSNIVGPITISMLGGANSSFSVDKGMNEAIDGECGAKGSVVLTVSYNPQNPNEAEYETMRVTDGTTTVDFALSGVASVTERNIVWEQGNAQGVATAYTVETPELTARTEDAFHNVLGSVYYGVNDNNTAGASVAGNVLSFTSAGQVFVTAYPTQDTRYSTPSSVTKRFDVAITPTTISTLPTIQGTIYGGTAAEDVVLADGVAKNTVNNETVNGTFKVISPTTLNAGTYALTVQFTPEDENMYTGCTATLENVTIAQRTPEESELGVNVGTIIYGQRIDEASMTNTGSLAGKWYWKDEDANKEVKAVGTYDNLNVYFEPENTNYATVYSTVSVTVNKATPEVTAQASAITYGQAISASELSTATGNISGTWAWAVDEEQVLSVGDHVLKANFTSTNANYSDLSNVDVTLKVNKIEKLEVPVALSFCAGGSVNFHGNTYSEAGEYQVEAEGATRDTVYNVTVTELQPTTGTDSKTITVGANESWNGIDLSIYAIGSHEVVFHTENVAGCDSTVTLTLTVVPATNIFTNATENGDWDDPANWQSGIVPTGDPNIFVTGDLIIDEDITVGNLTIESTGSVAVISGGTLTVNGTSEDRTEYGDVHVMSDGALALGNSANLQVRDFTLDAALGNSSNAATSGQVSGDVNLHINRDAYFQMSFDPRGYITLGWYDMTVPFEVEVLNGIYDNYMNKLTNGVDYLVMSYDEVKRASSGNGWALFNGTMQPGRIYTITLEETKTWNTFIFKKKSGSNLLSNGSCTAQYSSIGEAKDRGWNGLGNGTLQHRELTGLSGRKVQVYNFQEKIYEAFDADEKAYAVGTAFFVQADANMGTIDLTTTDGTKALRAPQYASRALDEFRLTLTAEGEDRYIDRIWVSASEEATGEYVIGHDLLKMGTPKDAKVAQMWTVNNDLRLCDIEMPLMDDKAQCPISFFAPQAQTYEIAVDQAPEDATLYLTYNDRIIWSLSASPYTIDLTKGTTEGYGLRIVARHNAPSVATGMDELNVDEDGNRKVLIDNMLYIITPEGAMYSVTGEKVK